MQIQGMHHFTIRTALLEETTEFYQRVIGLEVGERPNFGFPGRWLYAGAEPILHLVYQPNDRAVVALNHYLGEHTNMNGSGAIDHIALRGTDLNKMQCHLSRLSHVRFQERIVPDLQEHQLFLHDPNGITIEVIFPYSADNRIVGESLTSFKLR